MQSDHSNNAVTNPLSPYPQTVWITGASSGIGKELALEYARLGCSVFASARGKAALENLTLESCSMQGEIIALPLDVTDPSAIANVILQFERGDVIPDLCILNAGYYEVLAFDDLNLEHFEKTFAVNFSGVIGCLLAIAPSMKKKGSGHIAVVSSVAGYAGLPNASAYGASKAALINLCESLKHDFEKNALTLSLVNPGFVKTPMTDKNRFTMPFLMTPQEAANRTVKGLAKRHFEVTFPRRFTWLLKIMRLLPYPIFFWLTRKLT